MAGFLGGAISQVKTRLAVDNATSSADEPTPIYVLDELVTTLSAGDARAAVDAVCTRLAHRSPIVKQKALKLVTHIGRRGGADLRRLMARQSGVVRDLLHYRCDPDPFKGDTVWKRVQEYAQEALEAVHGTGPEAGAAATGGLGSSNTLGGRIQGFGSDAAGGYGGASSGMMAFGSDAGGHGGGSGSRVGRMVGFGSGDAPSQASYSSFSGGAGPTSSSGYGGPSRPAASGGLSQPIVQAGSSLGGGAGAATAGRAAPSAAEAAGPRHAAEQRLVDRLCTPAGLRAAPGSEDLKAFVEGLGPLDGDVVARLLEKKLEAGPWQSTLRALCAIEAVAESGSSASAGQLAVHFQADPEPVRRAARSPQASVRQRAQKLLGLLGDGPAAGGGGGGTTADPAAAGASQHQQLFTDDLLGAAEPAGAGPASSGLGGDLVDMLGEPAALAAASDVPAASAVDLLAGLDVSAAPAPPPQPAAAAPAAPAADDIFGGMLLGGGSQHLGAGAAAGPTSGAASAAPDMDLLGGLSLEPSPASTAQPQQPLQQVMQPTMQQQPGGDVGGLGDLLGGLALGPAPLGSMGGSSMGSGSMGGGSMGGGSMGGGSMGSMRAMPSNGFGGMAAGGGAAHGGNMGMLGGSTGAGTAYGMAGSSMQPVHFGAVPVAAAMQPAGIPGGAVSAFQQTQQQAQQAPLVGLSSLGSGGLHGTPHHGRQPSLGFNGAQSGGSAVLGELGILDSTKDNSFNFVDDAIAAARRRT